MTDDLALTAELMRRRAAWLRRQVDHLDKDNTYRALTLTWARDLKQYADRITQEDS